MECMQKIKLISLLNLFWRIWWLWNVRQNRIICLCPVFLSICLPASPQFAVQLLHLTIRKIKYSLQRVPLSSLFSIVTNVLLFSLFISVFLHLRDFSSLISLPVRLFLFVVLFFVVSLFLPIVVLSLSLLLPFPFTL